MISLTFNRESRWQLVFFSNMSFNFIYIYDSSFYGVILFYMFQCWIHDHWGVHQSQHDKQLYQVDLWLLQVMLISSTNLSLSSPYRRIAWGGLFNLMSCCRGGTVLVHPPFECMTKVNLIFGRENYGNEILFSVKLVV
jgi:hypothetical protein